MTQSTYSDAAATAASYYDSTDADHFYADIWGGEDIHIGLYAEPDEAIAAASRRTPRASALGTSRATARGRAARRPRRRRRRRPPQSAR